MAEVVKYIPGHVAGSKLLDALGIPKEGVTRATLVFDVRNVPTLTLEKILSQDDVDKVIEVCEDMKLAIVEKPVLANEVHDPGLEDDTNFASKGFTHYRKK